MYLHLFQCTITHAVQQPWCRAKVAAPLVLSEVSDGRHYPFKKKATRSAHKVKHIADVWQIGGVWQMGGGFASPASGGARPLLHTPCTYAQVSAVCPSGCQGGVGVVKHGVYCIIVHFVWLFIQYLNHLVFIKIYAWFWILLNRFEWFPTTANSIKNHIWNYVALRILVFGFCGFGIRDL